MIGTHRIEMSNVVGVEILQPHDAGDAINAVGNFGRFVAAELFATTNHGYNSREHTVPGGESDRRRAIAALPRVGDAGLDPTTSTM